MAFKLAVFCKKSSRLCSSTSNEKAFAAVEEEGGWTQMEEIYQTFFIRPALSPSTPLKLCSRLVVLLNIFSLLFDEQRPRKRRPGNSNHFQISVLYGTRVEFRTRSDLFEKCFYFHPNKAEFHSCLVFNKSKRVTWGGKETSKDSETMPYDELAWQLAKNNASYIMALSKSVCWNGILLCFFGFNNVQYL